MIYRLFSVARHKICVFLHFYHQIDKLTRFKFWNISRQTYQYLQFLSKLAEICTRWLHYLEEQSLRAFLKILKIGDFMLLSQKNGLKMPKSRSFFVQKWHKIANFQKSFLKAIGGSGSKNHVCLFWKISNLKHCFLQNIKNQFCSKVISISAIW